MPENSKNRMRTSATAQLLSCFIFSAAMAGRNEPSRSHQQYYLYKAGESVYVLKYKLSPLVGNVFTDLNVRSGLRCWVILPQTLSLASDCFTVKEVPIASKYHHHCRSPDQPPAVQSSASPLLGELRVTHCAYLTSPR